MGISRGQTIQGYELREEIGSGGFGAVFRAYQPGVDREVAIKVILPAYANHPDFIRRFEAEAHLVARLEHMNIVPLYDYWRHPNGAYLVMRYLRGGSLRDRLKSGPLSLKETARLVEQMSAALTVAHRHGVIHRDLKPANILLDEEGNTYLTDFGIAKVLPQASEATQESIVIGSPAYLSPEQIKGELITPATDIYSFGILIFEALTGQHPFSDSLASASMLNMHLSEPLPHLDSLHPELPSALDDLIQKATRKGPSARYLDTLSLAADFRHTVQAVREQPLMTDDVSTIRGARRVEQTEKTWTPADDLLAVRNPYKGLHAFEEADSKDFFGRKALVDYLLAELDPGNTSQISENSLTDNHASRFLAIVGPSGSGKSSVVKAGLIPALRAGKLPGSDQWLIAEMLPGAHPLEELELVLTRFAATPDLDLLPMLRENERGLLRAARKVLPAQAILLLVIDQFEEVFTLIEKPEEASQFMAALYAAVTDPHSPLRIIITLRADFYDRPLMHPEFSELISQRTRVIVPMTPKELEEAVTAPISGSSVTLEPGLVAAIIAEIHEQPGALPLLQYALTEIFDRREDHILTLKAYHAIGRTLGALARRADEVYQGLNSDEQDATRQMFLRLVTLGEGIEDTRRRVLQSELLTIGTHPDLMRRVIATFDRSRLLSFDRDPAAHEPTLEIAHEALIREWARLRAWLDESRSDIRLQRRLALDAQEWLINRRDSSYLLNGTRLTQFQDFAQQTEIALTPDEQAFLKTSISENTRRRVARRRIRNSLLAAVALLALVMALLALVALRQRATAQHERDGAQTARQTSDANAVLAQQNAERSQSLYLAAEAENALNNGNPDLALALALEAYHLDPTSLTLKSILVDIASKGGTYRRFAGETEGLWDAAFTPDERGIVAVSNDGFVLVWDIETGKLLQHFEPTGGIGNRQIIGIDISPDGQTALLTGWSNKFSLWDFRTGAHIRDFVGHSNPVWVAEFSPDGSMVLSGGIDDALILWDTVTAQEIRRFNRQAPNLQSGAVRSLVFSPDGRTALSTSPFEIVLWE